MHKIRNNRILYIFWLSKAVATVYTEDSTVYKERYQVFPWAVARWYKESAVIWPVVRRRKTLPCCWLDHTWPPSRHRRSVSQSERFRTRRRRRRSMRSWWTLYRTWRTPPSFCRNLSASTNTGMSVLLTIGRAEMYAGRVACRPLVTHNEYAEWTAGARSEYTVWGL